MSSISLIELKKQLEKLTEIQYQEIFKILLKHNEKYTINTNGIFVNISILKRETTEDIAHYIEFCKKSDVYLNELDSDRRQDIC